MNNFSCQYRDQLRDNFSGSIRFQSSAADNKSNCYAILSGRHRREGEG